MNRAISAQSTWQTLSNVKSDGAYEFDWQRYEQAIRLATRFLDNIIDMNKYPVGEVNVATNETRRIGLGIMGIADLLFLLKIPYDSKDGYEFMNKLAEAVSYLSMDESVAIAKSRGPFPLFKNSDYVKGRIPVAGYYELPRETHTYDWDTLIEKIKKHGIRNSWNPHYCPDLHALDDRRYFKWCGTRVCTCI